MAVSKVQGLKVAQSTAQSWGYDLSTLGSDVTPGNLLVVGFSVGVPEANVVAPTGGAGSAWASVIHERASAQSAAIYWRLAEAGDIDATITASQDTGGDRSGTGYFWELASVDLGTTPLTVEHDHASLTTTQLGNLAIPAAGWYIVANHRTTGTDGGNESWAVMTVASGHSQGSFAEYATPDDTDVNPTPTWPTPRAGVGVAVAFGPVVAAAAAQGFGFRQ